MSKLANRKALLAQIHINKKQLNQSDDEYRDLLSTVCGVDSSAKLDITGLMRFLDHQKACLRLAPGANAKPAPKKKLSPKAGKIFSLWQQLADAGLIQSRTFKSLEAWVKAQTGVDKLEWLNAAQSAQCIEQLKLWLARKSPLSGEKVICADVVAKGGA
jgi:phage gp16-like protein